MRIGKVMKIIILIAIGIAITVTSCAQFEKVKPVEITEASSAPEPIVAPAPVISLPRPPAAPAPSRPAPVAPPAPPMLSEFPPTGSGNKPPVPEKLILVPRKKDSAKQPLQITIPEIDYDAEFKRQLLNANTAVSIPERANISDDVRVELLISLQKESERLALDLSESGKRFSAPILVSRVVAATITAPDFEVKNITPERQILSKTDNTTWLWTLKPKNVGKHKIDIGVIAIIKLGNEETEHHIKTFKKTVEIEITATQIVFAWISKYWQWLASTIVIPLLLWAYKNRKKSTEQS